MSLFSDLLDLGIDEDFVEIVCFVNLYHDEKGQFTDAADASGGVKTLENTSYRVKQEFEAAGNKYTFICKRESKEDGWDV